MTTKTQAMKQKLSALGDPRVIDLLARLHVEADRQNLTLVGRFLSQLPRLLQGKPLSWERLTPRLSDLYLALDADNGLWCYLLIRALGARRVVELGTSMGISTIYLALAVRDNGGGTVIGTEIVPEKAARARQNLSAAGLLSFVDLRVGDARETLKHEREPIQFLLNDAFPATALPVLQQLTPQLAQGAVVMCGNAALFPADHAEYLSWVRNPEHGFRSMHLPMKFAGEFSVKTGSAVHCERADTSE